MRIDERAFLGYELGTYGSYELQGGEFLARDAVLLGLDGEGLFAQTGGTAATNGLYIAGYSGDGAGVGTYLHTGGTHYADYIDIFSAGSYILTDAAVLSSGDVLASGTFAHQGGTHRSRSIRAYSYSITGGELIADELRVIGAPERGIAGFDQDGGSLVTVDDTLLVSYSGGNYALYELRAGSLNVKGYEYIGRQGGQGLFRQTGGTHKAVNLSVRTFYENFSRLELAGGTLDISRSMDLQGGELAFPGPGGVLTLGDQASADFSRGALVNAGNGTINGGAESLIIFPSGFDPYSQLGNYSNPGLTHTAGNTLIVPVGKTVRFVGEIDDHVVCRGSLGGSFSLNAGVEVRNNGTLDLGQGTITVRDQVSMMDSGSISAHTILVGEGTDATFSHTGGTIDLSGGGHGDGLSVETDSGVATYELSGTAVLRAGSTALALYGGNANFIQTGGIHETGSLYITYYTSHPPVGRYEMSGGELHVTGVLWLGGYGDSRGTFRISEGTVTVDQSIMIATSGSIAVFLQEGGDVRAESLWIATSCAPADGTYRITDGRLEVGSLQFGVVHGNQSSLEISGASAVVVVSGAFEAGDTAKLVSEIGPAGISVVHCGNASLAGTWEVLDLGAGFGRFDVLHSSNGMSGMFSTVLFPDETWRWGMDGGTTLWVEHVPEPATLSLLALGGLALLRRRTGYGA